MAKSRGRKLADIIVTSGADIAGTLSFDGGSTSADLSFADSDKATFGDALDLQIYHDTLYSYIREVGTGDLRIAGANNVQIWNSDIDSQMANFANGGAVTLYHNNSAKLATTSTGINVTGSVTASTSMRVSDGEAYGFGDNSYRIEGKDDGANARIGFITGSSERMRLTSTGLGIGTTAPSSKLQIMGGTSGLDQISLSSNLTNNTIKYAGIIMTNYGNTTTALLGGKAENGTTSIFYGSSGSDHRGPQNHIFYTNASATATSGNTERMRITSAGNVGIGVTNPAHKLEISGGTIRIINQSTGRITFNNGSTEAYFGFNGAGSSTLDSGAQPLQIQAQGSNHIHFNTNSAERMRIDSSGNVLVGTTTSAPQNFSSGSGTQISDGYIAVARGGAVALLNRVSTDGDIVEFKKNGSVVGSIATTSNRLSIGSNDVGLFFDSTNERFTPIHQTNQADRDAAIDLGYASSRFKNLYLSGTVNVGSNTTISPDGSNGQIKQASGVLYYKSGQHNFQNAAGNSEYARFDTSGNLLVGTTNSLPGVGNTTAGISLYNDGRIFASKSANTTMSLNRSTSDGAIAEFRKDGTTVGSIGVTTDGPSFGNTTQHVAMHPAKLIPTNASQSSLDATIDLGVSSSRFKDLYLSGNIHLASGSDLKFKDSGGTNRDILSFDSNNDVVYAPAGAGVNNHIFKRNGSELMRLDTSGNVGIGTSGPSFSTVNSVTSASKIKGLEIFKDGTDTAAVLKLGADNGSGTKAFAQVGFSGANATAHFANFNTSGTQVGEIVIGSSGNVGIGTSTPESGLHLFDGTNVGSPQNANRRGTLIIEAGSEGSADIQLLNASYSHIFFGDAADPNTGMIWYQHAAGGSGADSMHFGTAGKADDITIKSNGFVGIGESNPARRLSVRRDTGITAGFNDISQFLDTILGVGGSVSLNLGRANSSKNLGKMAFKYAGSGSNSNALNFGFYDADNLMTLLASGNVGIGETSPDRALHVKDGALVVQKVESINTGGALIDIQHAGTQASNPGAYAGLRFYDNGGHRMSLSHITESSGNGYVQIGTSWSPGNEILSVHGNGHVGIGTNGPDSKLDVSRGTDTTGYSTTGDQRSEATITVRNASETVGTFAGINFYAGAGTGSDWSINNVRTGSYVGDLTFKTRVGGGSTDWRERMRIMANGNVGIGITNPGAALHISGTSAEQIRLQRSGHDTFRIGLSHSVGLGVYNVTDSRQDFMISGAGDVGIGTSNPPANHRLHIKTAVDDSVAQGLVIERSINSDRGYINYYGGGFQFRSTVGDPIVFGETDAEHMRILPDGNVGIGISSPDRTLHVTQDIKVGNLSGSGTNGSSGAGGIMISHSKTVAANTATDFLRIGNREGCFILTAYIAWSTSAAAAVAQYDVHTFYQANVLTEVKRLGRASGNDVSLTVTSSSGDYHVFAITASQNVTCTLTLVGTSAGRVGNASGNHYTVNYY